MHFTKSSNIFRAFLLMALAVSVFFSACKEKEPVKTKVYGTITIQNPETPAIEWTAATWSRLFSQKFSLDPRRRLGRRAR
ncbi:MAG: hypothetical protein IPM81_12920 [Saprospirales bacterium]|nr:hypothetical protein [Saprospirales bacterium]